MRNRTLAILFMVLTAFFFITPSPTASALNISITIYFGHGSNCRESGGICRIIIDLELRTADGNVGNGNAEGTIAGNMMDVSMLEAIPDGHLVKRGGKQLLILREDVQCDISPELGKELGIRNLTIQKGQYEVSFDGNGNGTFSLKLRTQEKTTPQFLKKGSAGR